ncbi:MAG: threonine synthase [Bacteroidetes bacterium]|nr:threonine synthase [Bacteroidota bacterium]
MQYYSLKKQSPPVNFETATILGQAPDKGLYFPECIPQFDSEFITQLDNWDPVDLAVKVMEPYVGEEIDQKSFRRIVEETIDFPIPLVPVTDRISTLELFHGPTLAFKDVGARFMSRCLGYFVKQGTYIQNNFNNRHSNITVLVATSGDTGGAVASGFYQVDGVEVVILYPAGKVSKVQEQQLTTFGHNIQAIAVNGNFDDCQQMVKQAFADATLTQQRLLTSANSINVARWLPQQLYYLLAYRQWKDKNQPPVISVPSGNFGNICAGILAHISGMPVDHFIAACNANDVIPRFMQSGNYEPSKAIPTISNAMDVADPSNFIRILELFHQSLPALASKFSSVSISDEATQSTLLRLYQTHHYLADPHGAVGYLALENYLTNHPGKKGIFLETAHPVKFYDVIEPVIGEKVPVPPAIQKIMDQPGTAEKREADYLTLRDYLLRR